MNKTLYFFAGICLLFASCKKDYIIGGDIEDIQAYKNTSTFDVLKQSSVYDTLVQVLEAGNLQSAVNATNTTFFAPTDFTILSYLNSRTLFVQANYGASKIFGLDSLIYYVKNNIKGTRDSLQLYIVSPRLNYEDLTMTGKFYNSGLAGKQVIVSFEETRDPNLGYNPVVSTVPRVEYFSYLRKPYDLDDDNPASDIPTDVGVRVLCKISGLQTQNGIMNQLSTHALFFHQWR